VAAEIGPALINTVGIVGAGQMGNGIAHVVSLAGIDVLMLDAKPEMVEKAFGVIGKNLDRQVGRGAITADQKAAATRQWRRAIS
jgi:3-hydroxybutyryl-CoA dehydrogenase